MKNVLVVRGSNDYNPGVTMVSMTDAEYEELKEAHLWSFDYCVPNKDSMGYSRDLAVSKLVIALDRGVWGKERAEEYRIPMEWCGKFKDRMREFKDGKLPDDCYIIYYQHNG